MNSSGHAALLVTSSWKIWLRDVVKTKRILAAIRGLRERIIHTNKALSQGSYKTVISSAHCSQTNRMTTETESTTGKGSSWKKQAQQEAELESTDQKVLCGITDWGLTSLSFSNRSHALVIVCSMEPPLQTPQWLLASCGGDFSCFLAGKGLDLTPLLCLLW